MNSKGGSGKAAPTLKIGALDLGSSWFVIIDGCVDSLLRYIGQNPEIAATMRSSASVHVQSNHLGENDFAPVATAPSLDWILLFCYL